VGRAGSACTRGAPGTPSRTVRAAPAAPAAELGPPGDKPVHSSLARRVPRQDQDGEGAGQVPVVRRRRPRYGARHGLHPAQRPSDRLLFLASDLLTRRGRGTDHLPASERGGSARAADLGLQLPARAPRKTPPSRPAAARGTARRGARPWGGTRDPGCAASSALDEVAARGRARAAEPTCGPLLSEGVSNCVGAPARPGRGRTIGGMARRSPAGFPP
jgi:hypothetical protein